VYKTNPTPHRRQVEEEHLETNFKKIIYE